MGGKDWPVIGLHSGTRTGRAVWPLDDTRGCCHWCTGRCQCKHSATEPALLLLQAMLWMCGDTCDTSVYARALHVRAYMYVCTCICACMVLCGR